MSEYCFKCCNKNLDSVELWVLKDIKNFMARKLFFGTCKYCKEKKAFLIETRISDNKKFKNEFKNIEAVKVIYREKKRKLITIPDIKKDSLYGWVYGVNVEIKDKKGTVTQVRQYASDFKGNKKIVKSINNGTP